MKVALFFNHQYSFIGINDNSISNLIDLTTNNSVIKYQWSPSSLFRIAPKKIVEYLEKKKTYINVIESKYLFQNTDLFSERLQHLIKISLKEKLPIIDEFIMAVNGYVNEAGLVLANNRPMEQVLFINISEGLNIKTVFNKFLFTKNIQLTSDVKAICSGINPLISAKNKPCLVIYIHRKVNFAIIDEDNNAEPLPIGDWNIDELGNHSASYLLGTLGIDRIIESEAIDINENYTKILGDVIDHYLLYFLKFQVTFKSIYVFSDYEQLIHKQNMKERFLQYKVLYPENTNDKSEIAIEGCLNLSSKPIRSQRVTRIEYWNKDQLINSFSQREDFINHLKMWGKTANPENTYRVYGQNRLINIYKLSDIKYDFVANSIFN